MILKGVSLKNFRNYTSQELEFGDAVNIFAGKNAQGKTNLLESIHFLSTGRSFRTSKVTELIRKGAEFLQVEGLVEREESLLRLRIYYSEKAKRAQLNARKLTRFQEIVGLLNVVVFAPDDIEIVKGPPSGRRRYLDMQIAQTNRAYMEKLHSYSEIVRQRNAVLKSGKLATLDVWDDELVKHGVAIILRRKETVRRLNLLARLTQRKITEGREELQIEYPCDVEGDNEKDLAESFRKQLRAKREQEKRTGNTVVGPHRDDIVFEVNGLDARNYASEGQRRSVAISLRLAQYELVKAGGREKPAVLIDDVTAELDAMRKRAFLPLLAEKGQIFVATASDEKVFKEWRNARLFTVEKGSVF